MMKPLRIRRHGKYSVILFDILGKTVYDHRCCARTKKKAVLSALRDIRMNPLSNAIIYRTDRHDKPVPVLDIDYNGTIKQHEK